MTSALLRLVAFAAVFGGALIASDPASARVAGEPHRLVAAHRVVGGVAFTGNTLMTQSVVAPQVNANLLDSSPGDVRDVPFDAELVAAYLFWAGSTDGEPDRRATLVAADGARFQVDAEVCFEVDDLGGSFGCRAEVTGLLAEHGGDARWNGTYAVGDVQASVGLLRPNGSCRNANCQARFAGWSLVLVYASPQAGALRDVFLHDGYRFLDEDDAGSGIDQFQIGGFDFPEGGQATLAFFGLEGDAFLGVPPQDADPIQPCATCFDFFEFAGARLGDALNPPGNIFNSSSPGGFTLGLDLDRFDVSALLAPGQTDAQIRVGSGDGQPGGGGEAFVLGWVLLDVERSAPNFSLDQTALSVVPDEAAPLEAVVYSLRVSNQGTRDAVGTRVTLALPPGMAYLPGSLRVDGLDPVPGDEAQNPLAAGFALGDLPFRGDTDRLITLRATVDAGAAPGSRLVARALIEADNLDAPARTNEAVLTVLGLLPPDEVVKTALDGDGDGRFAPGEQVVYEIFVANPNDRPLPGVRLTDALPRQLDLLRVFSNTGEDRSVAAAGQVELVDMSIPPGGTTVTILARLHDAARLVAEDGVPAGGVDGFVVQNQATVTVGLDAIPSAPRFGAAPAATTFPIRAPVAIDGPRTGKAVEDLDGPPLRPGDALRFVITVDNTGPDAARVAIDDVLPPALEGCALEGMWPGLACVDGRLQGLLDVPAGAAVGVPFTARVRADAPDGAVVRNTARLSAGGAEVVVQSPALAVSAPAGPALVAEKTVVGAPGGVVGPGATLTWTVRVSNRGDTPSEPITVVDPLGFAYAAVRPGPGGVFDGVSNTVTWRVDPLAPGASTAVEVSTTLPDGVADGTPLSNQARVVSAGLVDVLSDDPGTPAAGDATRVTVRAAALRLVKAVDVAAAPPGAPVVFTLTLANDGGAPALDPEVVDPLPAGLVGPFVLDRADARMDGRTVRWRPGRVEPGAALSLRVEARIAEAAPVGAQIVNAASVGGLRAEARLVVSAAPRVELQKRVDVEAFPGGAVVYLLALRNVGGAATGPVELRDPLPAEVVPEGFDPPPDAIEGGAAVWRFDDLPPGAEVLVRVQGRLAVDVEAGQVVSNRAVADAGGLLVDSDDPATPAVDATAFTVVGGAELSISKTLLTAVPPGGLPPGAVVEYRVEVRNEGLGETPPLEVRDRLDAAFVAGLSSAVDGRIVDGEARWTLDDGVPGGSTRRFVLRARLANALEDGRAVSNTARLLDAQGALRAESAPVVFRVGTGGLVVAKTVSPLSGAGFAPGAPVEYRIRVDNTRDAAVADVTIADVLDPVLTEVQPLDGGVFDAQIRRVQWTPAATGVLRLVPAAASVVVRLQARIAADAPAGHTVRNVARASVAGDPAEAQGEALFVVAGAARYAVDKRVEPGPTDTGAALGYTITITNVGDGPGDGLTFFDALPGGLSYLPGSTRVDGGPVADLRGRAPFADGLLVGDGDGRPGRLLPGQSVTVQFDVRIDAAAGVEVVNRARVEDAAGREASGEARFVVGAQPDLSAFTKTYTVVEDPDARRARVGQTIEWTLRLGNTGAGVASEVEIVDPIGAGLEPVGDTIEVDGVALTAALDRDAAEIVDGVLRVRLGDLGPGEGAIVRFRTRVTRGPSVQNQAVARAARAPDQPSDDGGADENRPTVVPVGEAPVRAARLSKVADRAATETVAAGEAMRFTLRVENTGTVDLSGLSVIDRLPGELLFEDVIEAFPGSEILIGLAPGSAEIEFADFDVPAGAAATAVLAVRVDPALAPGPDGRRTLCNRAEMDGPGIEAAEAEACVAAEVRDGSIAGVVFEDRNGNGVFEPPVADPTRAEVAGDLPFADMRVALSRAADPDGPPVAEARTDAAGRFALEAPPGEYRARVFTAADVLMRTVDGLVVLPSQAVEADLLIDPSGRVYDSVEGTLIDGAEVFIYRDADTDDDPFDPESRAARVLVPPSELEAASQQGQRTANGGLYRFAVRRPGRYIVEVVPPGTSYVSPSVRVPPVPGVAFTDDPEGRVVEAELPSVAPDADRTYFLAFDLVDVDDFFQHNHIPVDPLSALIDVQKRARRAHASVGDVATFEVDIINRSPEDLLYDPRTRTGGVYLQDVLPAGLKYVNRTATLTRVRGGVEEPLNAADPEGTRILRFGRIDVVDGEAIARPMDLHAGEHLRLRYHVVIGADARPRRVVTNRAQLIADGNIPVSRVAEAALHIVADPDFDQGLLLGRVWCDADRDGERDADEAGVGGARLYLDNGYLAITDAEGRFHFKDIDPGTHAVKLDASTLLPGAELTTDEVRVIHFTRGLPARVGFGVTCPAETVQGATLTLAEDGLAAALAGLRDRYALVTGEVDALRLRHGDATFEAPPIAVALYVDGQRAERPDLPPGALGAAAELEFRVSLDPRAPTDRWGLFVGPIGEPATLVAGGEGPPPAAFVWDQKGPDGRALLAPGEAYAYRLEVAGAEGLVVGSPAGTFGVGLSQPPPPELLARVDADDVGEGGAIDPALRAALEEALPTLRAAEGPLVVEGHHDNSLGVFSARSLTRRKAEAVVEALVALGLPAERLSAEGLGGGRPLAPNFTARNQRRNRRIDIVRRPPAPPEGAEVPAPAFEPVVRVDAEAVAPDAQGRFALAAPVPPEGVVEVLLQAADGRRAMFPVRVRPGLPRPDAAPRTVLVEGSLPGGLSVGGRPAPPPLQPPQVRAPLAMTPGEPARFDFTPPGAIDGWRFAVMGPDGGTIRSAEGAGPPPVGLEWTPDPALPPGLYRYRLTVRAGATVAQSPAYPVRIGGDDARPPLVDASGRWTLSIDGRPAIIGPDGRVSAPQAVVGDTPLLLELTAPDGGRVVYFVAPPALAEQPAAPAIAAPANAAPANAAPAAPEAPPARAADAPPPGGGGPTASAVTARPAPAERPALAAPAPSAPVVPLPPEAAAALADFGRRELLQALAPALAGGDADVPARTLTVDLPAEGATLAGRSVPIRGATAPGNRVFLNGSEVAVDADGRFAGAVDLPPGPGQIEVATVDPGGNRGVVRRAVTAPESGWFLLALGETVTGQLQSPIDGVEPHTRFDLADSVYVHGRAAAWFRGYMKGSDILGGLVDEYRAEVHLDTARRAEYEAAFRQLVDPEQFYPVYGDDAALDKPINTRGPLYVLLEADDNTARIGNFLTGLAGIELFRYDRALYGAAIEIDQPTGDFRHKVTAFAADGDLGQRHAYVELRGTGGSLYYLPHRELVEGSEQVFLVERDRISGIERRRTALARDLDYTVRYEDGRILMKQPVPSVTLDSFGARLQPDRGEVLDGHPVYLAIEYDHLDPLAEGDTAVGVRASETWSEHVRLGGGWVREGRGDGSPAYQLWGADLTLRAGRRTRLEAEWARSQSVDSQALQSDDGGLSFEPFNRRDGRDARGDSFLVRGGLELDDLVGEGDRDRWYTEGYWQYIAPGFYAGGVIREQGLEKYGGASRYVFDGGHALHVRHDGVISDAPQTQGPAVFGAFRRDVTRAGYGYRTDGLILDVEFVHTTFEPGGEVTDAPDGIEGTDPTVSDAIAAGLQYRLAPRWTALVEQEVILRSDQRIHDETLDLLTTSLGLRYQIDEALHVEAIETLRWSGANATQIGLRTDIDETTSLYLQERFQNEDRRNTSTTVVGGEQRFGRDRSGRAYGEYQLEYGTLGQRDRAVFGLGKRWQLTDALAIDGGYERSQVVGGSLGEFSRDALTLGVEWLDGDRLKVTGRYELRYEDNDEAFDRRDRLQLLALNALSLKIARDVHTLLRLNYSSTTDLEYEATEAELLELSAGLAWRPAAHDWLAVLFKYTKRYEQRPIDLAFERPEREESDTVSLIPIVELPWGFQIVEKIAIKRAAVEVETLPTVVNTTVLWINRLNYHLTETWDAGVEYRVLAGSLSSTVEHGALVELNYILQKRIRLGVGYNFTSFGDDEFAEFDADYGGPFFRVTAHY